MNYKNLGRTGLKVSQVILGCGNFGGIGSAPAFYGKGETEEESHAILDAAWDLGINVFDTANAYGGGRSESYIGNWLRRKGSRVRDQLILSSKVFNPVGDGPTLAANEKSGATCPTAIKDSVISLLVNKTGLVCLVLGDMIHWTE